MSRTCAWILAVFALFLAPGCRSAPTGVVSIEPRGAATANFILYLFGMMGGTSSNTEEDPEEDPPVITLSAIPEARSLGVRAFVNTPYVDLIVGEGRHRIDDEYVREQCIGLRVRGEKKSGAINYFDVVWRHGYDFEGPSGSTTDYDGMEIGGGVLLELTDRWYLDIGLGLETTFDRLEVHSGGRTEHVAGLLAHIGLMLRL